MNVLVLAVWFGLVTGIGEAFLLGVRKFALHRAIRFGPEITWLAPLADALLFLLLGFLIVAWRRTRARDAEMFGVAVGVFTFFALLSALLTYYPLQLYAKLLLSAGVAVQVARLTRRQSTGIERLVRVTLPMLVVAVIAVSAFTSWRTASVLGRGITGPEPPAAAPNVLLIVLDTVRAENMSLYGYGRPTTPNLQRFAQTGVVFDRAIATAPWTLTTHGSLFTGRFPHELSATLERPLDATHPTLAEVLRAKGYATAGFVANTHYGGYEFGLSRGFSYYEDYNLAPRELLIASTLARSVVNSRPARKALRYYDNIPRKNARSISEAFLDWLPSRGSRPFFAFLNYFDAHETYLPPLEFAQAFGPEGPRHNELLSQDVRRSLRDDWHLRPASEIKAELDMYDASIAYLDWELARLFDRMQAQGLLENTLVVVTSDHGEQFGEHGLFLHGNSLYAPLLHVPLLMAFPNRIPVGERVARPISLRDVPATILDLAASDARSQLPGASLRRFWDVEAGANDGSDVILSEVGQADWGKDWYPISRGDMASLIDGEYHYIRNGDGVEELYAWWSDRSEARDLSKDVRFGAVLERLRATLTDLVPAVGTKAGR